MRNSAVSVLSHALGVAGMPPDDAKSIALRLAAEGRRATRGVPDGAAFLVTKAALHSAGLPAAAAKVLAIALGQSGYRIEGEQ